MIEDIEVQFVPSYAVQVFVVVVVVVFVVVPIVTDAMASTYSFVLWAWFKGIARSACFGIFSDSEVNSQVPRVLSSKPNPVAIGQRAPAGEGKYVFFSILSVTFRLLH